MTRETIYEFFGNFDIVVGVKHPPISHKRFASLIRSAESWHGAVFARFVFDCFSRHGDKGWILDMKHSKEEVETK